MSGKFVRASKYRHVFGQAAKKELCYDNLKVTKNAWDSNLINCNGKYLSVNWEASGGGAFAVIPLSEFGKAPDTVPLFRGHKGPVLDTAFNPFNKQQIASCSDDGQILLWEIPEDFSFHNYRDANDELRDVTEPLKVLSGHTRKVGHIGFHPCAENVLASASMDYSVKIWNLETGKAEITLQHKDLVTWFAFNYNGTLLATTSRDKTLRIWDIRSGKVISEGPGHSGVKSSRVVWLGNTDRICTTGFSRLSDRQTGIWDVSDISKGPIDGFMVVDSSSGVLIPVFDEANSILYLAGKGDGNIRYYEYDNDVLHELSQFSSTDAQRGFAVAPKTSVNIKENEVLKAYKTVNDHLIEPISFIVPRKSELFQGDIYPDAPSHKPALTASEFFEGKVVNGPLLVSMEAIYEGSESEVRESTPAVSISEKKSELASAKTSPIKQKTSEGSESAATDSIASSPAPRQVPKENETVDDVLKTSGKVDDLLTKVVDESDDEDSKRIQESNEQDDEWEEVKKPIEESPKAETNQPESPKEDQPKESYVELSSEAKPEDSPVVLPGPDLSKRESQHDAKAESSTSAIGTVKSTPDASSTISESKSAPSSGQSGQPTLRSTVDKLATLVESLEGQIEKLVSANIEKNDKIVALEKKVENLLKK